MTLISCVNKETVYTVYCKKGGIGGEMFLATFASNLEADSYIENTKGCRIEESYR